jgi:hypothetical protein
MVYPVALGSGSRLFGERRDKLTLRLAESTTFVEGVALHIYMRGNGDD